MIVGRAGPNFITKDPQKAEVMWQRAWHSGVARFFGGEEVRGGTAGGVFVTGDGGRISSQFLWFLPLL